MKYAVVNGTDKDGTFQHGSYVENLIVMDAGQDVDVMERALSRRLVEQMPLGLDIGDMYNGIGWTRNVGGEQVALPILTASRGADEVLAILEGYA